MNNDSIDEVVSTGLQQATRGTFDTTPEDLAAALEARRSRPAGTWRGRRRMLAVGAAAACLAALVAGIALSTGGDDGGLDVVGSTPEEPETGFAGYDAGWHEIDPGPVPAMSDARLAWTGTRLVVAGTTAGAQEASVYTYDPTEGSWTRLPDPGLSDAVVVAAGEDLVAVGNSPGAPGGAPSAGAWKTLGPGDDAWVDHGEPVVAPELVAMGALGPPEPSGHTTLLWTGERVIDPTHGSVLDPADGTSTALQMPGDPVGYTNLITSNAVWTGTEAVATSWGEAPGLAWNAVGTGMREVPGLPVSEGASPGYTPNSIAVAGDGRVFLFEREARSTGRAAVLDPRSGQWEALPPVPVAAGSSYCPSLAAAAGADVLVGPCDWTNDTAAEAGPTAPLLLADGSWESVEAGPWEGPCCTQRWLGVDGALVVWDTDTDTTNNPEAPYVRAAVWIPGARSPTVRPEDRSPAATPPDATRPDAAEPESTQPAGDGPPLVVGEGPCTLEELPDLTLVMPAELDTGPEPGLGGTDIENVCARHWGSSVDRGMHVTQVAGELLNSIEPAERSVNLEWGPIHEGWGLHYAGDPAWSLAVYGLDEAEFRELVEGVAAGLEVPLPRAGG